jgi:hypothetical protein
MSGRVVPTPRERELARTRIGAETEAELLARYREEVLHEFVELQKDLDAMGDVKLARALREIIDTTRGVP